jgi:hypothetical protein
MSLNP